MFWKLHFTVKSNFKIKISSHALTKLRSKNLWKLRTAIINGPMRQQLIICHKKELQKPPREPQGYQRYRSSGRGTIANQMKKEEKTMSINKHVDDHNITGIAQVSIRYRFRPCSRDSSGGRTTRKPN